MIGWHDSRFQTSAIFDTMYQHLRETEINTSRNILGFIGREKPVIV